ncbi:hypothetical protein BofuT4_uP078850.1 [Botrytis cinerea T4]|uniref:Uncharacterized protein n=1 Tax=Botryotinia fuckeliana (strain T4) TaxID=999810 RepID=G2YL72_BOTF4|nr:hypothetical protein BofuT4_uP078850.1 [Botrytis cinerea T4]
MMIHSPQPLPPSTHIHLSMCPHGGPLCSVDVFPSNSTPFGISNFDLRPSTFVLRPSFHFPLSPTRSLQQQQSFGINGTPEDLSTTSFRL